MGHTDRSFRDEFFQKHRLSVNGLDPVMDKKDLAFALNLPYYGHAENIGIVLHDIGFNRLPVFRRRGYDGEVAYPRH